MTRTDRGTDVAAVGGDQARSTAGGLGATPARRTPRSQSSSRRGVIVGLVGLVGAAAIGSAVIGAVSFGSVDGWVAAVTIVVWAGGGVALSLRAGQGRLPLLMVATGLAGGVALSAWAQAPADDTAATWRAIAVASIGGLLAHLAIALPDGVAQGRRRLAVLGGYATAGSVAAALAGDAPSFPRPPLVAGSVVLVVLAAPCVARRCRRADHTDRARLQWAGLAALIVVTVTIATLALSVLTGWPAHIEPVAMVATVAVPVALVVATTERAVAVGARVLAGSTVGAGMVLAGAGVYVLVVVGFNGAPSDDERAALGLAMVATALIAVFALPVRRWLERFANQRVYGERESPELALQTFANRMSRSVPMDELLLQLAETLRKTMELRRAEVWTGTNGVLDLAVAVPDRVAARVVLGAEETAVAARAGVVGNAWLAIWAPALLAGREEQVVRVASVVHLGELLGMIVTERGAGEVELDEEQDRVLGDIARQLGLALHNVKLDSALQASLDELQVRNAELVSSRARVVAAADESRRRIERNLHDGAQQHLVAMAVKLGLARQLLDADLTTAATLVEELRDDVQVTLTELRELAHGIYPPLLRSRGLPEALTAAANRAVLPTTVTTTELDRFDPDVEAAVYFCCLEAIQNAGKHAGETATIAVGVDYIDGELRFEVRDDGVGFAPHDVAGGHGFVNMADRLGAIGGSLTVTSRPGDGTSITGRIPAAPIAAAG